MGLFSRKTSVAQARPKARPSISGEAQARELRVRARRRLIGALALVLAVVIVAPMLFDTTSQTPPESMIVVPMVVAPAADTPLAQTLDSATPGAGRITTADDAADTHEQPASLAQTTTQPPTRQAQPTPPTPAQQTQAAAARPSGNVSSTTPASPARANPPTQAREPERTDDGSVALALLEGRTPPAAGSASGRATAASNFVVQLGSYNTQRDATVQRDQLVQAGVTNAYVETAQINGQNAYRVRVGPFSTRDAAQAAQARVRALGDYKDAFITGQ